MEKEVGRPKKETTGFENKKTIGFQNKKPNENENVNVNDNENDNVNDSCIDGLQEVINFYENNIGAITPYGLEILQSYAEEMPVDLIIYAMQISVEANKKTIQYIKAILNNWQKANIKTLADAQKERKPIKQSRKANFTQREYTEEDFGKLIKIGD